MNKILTLLLLSVLFFNTACKPESRAENDYNISVSITDEKDYVKFTSLLHANESNLLDSFNNKSSFSEENFDGGDSTYNPSIQGATVDKSQTDSRMIADILHIEYILNKWSQKLTNKDSGDYLVLITKENKRPILVRIVKIQTANSIQFANINMQILMHKNKDEKYDITITTKAGKGERVERKKGYDLSSSVTYLSSYTIENKTYLLYSLIVK